MKKARTSNQEIWGLVPGFLPRELPLSEHIPRTRN